MTNRPDGGTALGRPRHRAAAAHGTPRRTARLYPWTAQVLRQLHLKVTDGGTIRRKAVNPVLEGARVRRPGSIGRARTPTVRTPRQPLVENLGAHSVLLSRPDWNRHAIHVYRRAEGSPATWHPPYVNARPRGSPGQYRIGSRLDHPQRSRKERVPLYDAHRRKILQVFSNFFCTPRRGVWGQRLTLDTPRTTQEQPQGSNGVSSVKR